MPSSFRRPGRRPWRLPQSRRWPHDNGGLRGAGAVARGVKHRVGRMMPPECPPNKAKSSTSSGKPETQPSTTSRTTPQTAPPAPLASCGRSRTSAARRVSVSNRMYRRRGRPWRRRPLPEANARTCPSPAPRSATLGRNAAIVGSRSSNRAARRRPLHRPGLRSRPTRLDSTVRELIASTSRVHAPPRPARSYLRHTRLVEPGGQPRRCDGNRLRPPTRWLTSRRKGARHAKASDDMRFVWSGFGLHRRARGVGSGRLRWSGLRRERAGAAGNPRTSCSRRDTSSSASCAPELGLVADLGNVEYRNSISNCGR